MYSKTIYPEIDTDSCRIGIAVLPCHFINIVPDLLSHVAPVREAVLSYPCVETWSTDVSGCTLCGEGILVRVISPQMPIRSMAHLQGVRPWLIHTRSVYQYVLWSCWQNGTTQIGVWKTPKAKCSRSYFFLFPFVAFDLLQLHRSQAGGTSITRDHSSLPPYHVCVYKRGGGLDLFA